MQPFGFATAASSHSFNLVGNFYPRCSPLPLRLLVLSSMQVWEKNPPSVAAAK
jgi:hypothetical protein